jgi:hypothetical protein
MQGDCTPTNKSAKGSEALAHEKKSEAGATFYKVSTLNKWFLVSSLLMTLCYLWSVVADHQRGWKQHQRAFMDYEWYTAEAKKSAVWPERNNRTLKQLFEDLDEGKLQVDSPASTNSRSPRRR